MNPLKITVKALAKTLFSLVLISTFSSCISNEKIIYLQNPNDNPEFANGKMITPPTTDYRLQYNDIIDVNVTTIDQLLQNGFSLSNDMQAQNMGMQMGQGGGDIYYMTGYSVDSKGEIDLPFLGKVKVKDLTLEEVKTKVEVLLKEYIKSEYFVRVKLGGIRYSALGEFRKPGKYVILQDRMTIFEAIANAGDLTTIAKRDKVILIRQYPEGTKIFDVNLNDRNILSSDFYYIKPNDQIYAEPLKVREIGAGENAAQTIALFVSLFTFVALVVNFSSK
jgi:polysaccharide export outer membrane protein